MSEKQQELQEDQKQEKREKKKEIVSSAIEFWPALFLLFLGLKLAELGQVAHWSWVWVFAPIWAPLSAALAFVLIGSIVAGIINSVRRDWQ